MLFAFAAPPLIAGACTRLGPAPNDGADLAPLVSAKALDVAGTIGGIDGYGGTMMNGYVDHADQQLRFFDATDLADPDSHISVTLQNLSDEACTFHLTYFASYIGLDEQVQLVEVPPGEETTVELSCSEILGMGSLESPGAVGCHLAGGLELGNTLAVPGFLGLDYTCGTDYDFAVTPDENDIDGDGDTEELILLSEGMEAHMLLGGPMYHWHNGGMMHGGMGRWPWMMMFPASVTSP
jgi:hypothetical protein